MGLTKFDGIQTAALVGPGSSRFYGWWTGTAYFVDYDNYTEGGDGLSPDRSFKNPKDAFDRMNAGDVVYIRPRNVVSTDTDPSYITPAAAANWSIARAQYNCAIIGAGPQLGSGQIHMTYLRGHASVTTATLGSSVLTVKAPYTSVENLAFHRGGSTRAQLEFYGDGTYANNAWGSSANNCLFRFMNNSTFGAVYIVDAWYCGVYNSHFYRNQVGVIAQGSSSTIRETEIKGNKFDGDTADVDAHVVILGSEGMFNYITDNLFCSGIPAKSGATYGVYIHTPAMESGSASIIARNYFAVDNAASDITEGTGVIRAGNWDGSGEVET